MQKKVSSTSNENKTIRDFGYVAGLAGISAVISGVTMHPVDTCKV